MVQEDFEASESRSFMPAAEQRHYDLLVELPDQPSVEWARRLLQDAAIAPEDIELVGTSGEAVSTNSGISAEEGVAVGVIVRRVIFGAVVGVVLGGIIGAVVASLAGGDPAWGIIGVALFGLVGGALVGGVGAVGGSARRDAVERAHPELTHPVLGVRATTPVQIDRAEAALREVETIRIVRQAH